MRREKTVKKLWSAYIIIISCSKTPEPSLQQAISHFVKVTQSCLTLCDPMDYTVHGILQARISPGDLPNPRIKPTSSKLQMDYLPAEPPGRPKKKYGTLHEFVCHPCAGAMTNFSVSFQFQYLCCQSERKYLIGSYKKSHKLYVHHYIHCRGTKVLPKVLPALYPLPSEQKQLQPLNP